MSRSRAALALAALLAASCAAPPLAQRDDELAARVDAALAQRGGERDLLQLVDNLLRHEQGPPAGAPALVRELLAQPLAAADAAGLFRRAVPEALAAFDERPQSQPAATLEHLLEPYLAELAAAQALLREAAGDAPLDPAAVLKELESELPSAERLRGLTRIDQALLQRANAQFVRATAQFVNRLRAAAPALRFPEQGLRFDSAVGTVSIGTRASDRHGPDAALIIDPGGDDEYERAPVSGGRVSVVIDLGGNDRYRGPDLVLYGLAALVDMAGDDRYAAAGPGLGAVILGASLLVDLSGNDSYEAELFAQGAAAFGLGALLDFSGDDQYRVRAAGQGFGMAGGVGLLWDRSGDDRYSAGGVGDAYGRGGEVSFAQGAAFGYRTSLGGGIGILRDDAGDDAYEAQMFAQGTGYYYGLGLLWDRSGDDAWRAVRYAQGNGVHEAVGILRDESGNDRYELSYGVGQGMGLDLGLGVLYDAAGNDRYRAERHAQGNATSNGIGVLFDRGGADEWHMSADLRAWGRSEPERGLPSVGLILYEPATAAFLREGVAVPPPHGGTPVDVPPAGERRCAGVTAAPQEALPFAEAVRSLEFLPRSGEANPGTHAYVHQRLQNDLAAALAELPGDDFTIGWLLGYLLPCALREATPEQAASMWTAMERVLTARPASPFALEITAALRERPAPPGERERLVDALQGHPSCAVRSAALRLRESVPAAQAALRSSCWRLQAAAVAMLARLAAPAGADARLPSFLRSP